MSIKKHLIIAIISISGVFLTNGLLAVDPQPEETEEESPIASYEIGFVSNYLDRGEDVFAGRAQQKQISYGANTGEWAFQPSIAFNTPLEGLSFEIWTSFAMAGRENKDVDGVFQRSPGGANALSAYDGNFLAMYQDEFSGWDILTPLTYEGCEEVDSCVPRLYKENNGLKNEDRLILTLDYAFENRGGAYSFGITSDSHVNSSNKDKPATEIYFVYEPSFLPGIGVETALDIETSDNYTFLSYGNEIDLNDSMEMAFGYSIGAGYLITDHKQGINDITGEMELSIGGFFVTLIGTHRPDLSFFDEDENQYNSYPYWIVGRSTSTDGMVADPAQQYGFTNTYANEAIQAFMQQTTGFAGYEYTPRQKLPRNLWAVRLGYRAEI